ncbi:MAG TPA: zinc ribbon domain-containing protein [Blastocatellia bacterium]|nr:zinc ribbon domain-containing protein [Blastocatellia bacterium]
MYCPNCAAVNTEGVKFCRSCGANLSLVPQALTGQLPEDRTTHRGKRRKEKKPPSLSEGIMQTFTGIGFLLVSFAVFFFAPAGKIWWFWMLLPAFSMMGKGVAEIISYHNQGKSKATLPFSQQPVQYPQNLYPQDQYSQPPRAEELPPRNTGPIFPPPSVTENTTRHLDPARERAKENN